MVKPDGCHSSIIGKGPVESPGHFGTAKGILCSPALSRELAGVRQATSAASLVAGCSMTLTVAVPTEGCKLRAASISPSSTRKPLILTCTAFAMSPTSVLKEKWLCPSSDTPQAVILVSTIWLVWPLNTSIHVCVRAHASTGLMLVTRGQWRLLGQT